MPITLSLLPKSLANLGPAELATTVRAVGLDTTNVMIRDGFACRPSHIAEDLPAFQAAMRAAGVTVTFATAAYDIEQLLADDTPLRVMADNGITQFRYNHLRTPNPLAAVEQARGQLAQLSQRCLALGLKALYQVHHGTCVASGSLAWYLVKDCDPRGAGVMLDPGNQSHEGFESPYHSAQLLGPHLGAWGVKDLRWYRDESARSDPSKGWRRAWCRLDAGVVNWHQVVDACQINNFNGTMVFMPFYHRDDQPRLIDNLAADVSYLRQLLNAAADPDSQA
ncbi:MAG: TIM barrel protein [Planctomycetota bacterium]|jgi:sugar phosphate isomerase/epimerase|nr:TIM barrel protein [Planctomycetota bacterium]